MKRTINLEMDNMIEILPINTLLFEKQSSFYTLLFPLRQILFIRINHQILILKPGAVLLLAPYITCKLLHIVDTNEFAKMNYENNFCRKNTKCNRYDSIMINVDSVKKVLSTFSEFIESFKTKHKSAELFLRFSEKLFPLDLLQIPEYAPLKQLLFRSEYGLYFSQLGTSNEFIKSFNEKNQYHPFLIKLSNLYKLLSFLIESEIKAKKIAETPLICAKKKSNDISDFVQQINKYIEQEYPENITLETLSKIAGITRTALSRSYKHKTNYTPFEYLKLVRINNACRLLVNTKKPVYEISYACGYNNISLFNRHFKHIKGIAPSDYRKHIAHI